MSKKGPPAFMEGKCNVSQFNFRKEVLGMMKLPKRVILSDVTMREGEDAAGVIFSTKDKVRLAKKLDEVGVPMIQVQWADHWKAVEEVKAITALGLNAQIMVAGPITGAGPLETIDKAADLDADWFELLVQKEPALGVKAVERAKKRDMKIRCDINGLAMRDLEFIRSYFKAVAEAGADQIYGSEHGVLSTAGTRYLVSEIKKVAPNTPLAWHAHNILGTSVANALAAVEAGAEDLDVAVNGLGGSGDGYIPLEEVAVILPALYGIETGIKLEKLRELSVLVEDLTKIPNPNNKPIVGNYAFSSAISPGRFPIEPTLVGNRAKIIFGKYSSPALVSAKLKELGLDLPERLMQKTLERIVDELEARKRPLTDDEFKVIVEEVKK